MKCLPSSGDWILKALLRLDSVIPVFDFEIWVAPIVRAVFVRSVRVLLCRGPPDVVVALVVY